MEDLIDELESLGIKPFLRFGVDFGIGKEKKNHITGKNTIYFTQDAVKFLKEVGYAHSKFSDSSVIINNEFQPSMTKGYLKVRIDCILIKSDRGDYKSDFYLKMENGNKHFPEVYHSKGKFRIPTIVKSLDKIVKDIQSLSR